MSDYYVHRLQVSMPLATAETIAERSDRRRPRGRPSAADRRGAGRRRHTGRAQARGRLRHAARRHRDRKGLGRARHGHFQPHHPRPAARAPGIPERARRGLRRPLHPGARRRAGVERQGRGDRRRRHQRRRLRQGRVRRRHCGAARRATPHPEQPAANWRDAGL